MLPEVIYSVVEEALTGIPLEPILCDKLSKDVLVLASSVVIPPPLLRNSARRARVFRNLFLGRPATQQHWGTNVPILASGGAGGAASSAAAGRGARHCFRHCVCRRRTPMALLEGRRHRRPEDVPCVQLRQADTRARHPGTTGLIGQR